MARDKILVELWNSNEVNSAIKKMNPVELQDDLKAEVFLAICELPEEKLILLYEKKELKFYLVRIMINMIQSYDKRFYGKYRNFQELGHYEKEDQEYSENTSDILIHVENLYWYQKEILNLYTFEFNKNAKELSRNTGIPYMSIIRTLNQVKQELKKKIRK